MASPVSPHVETSEIQKEPTSTPVACRTWNGGEFCFLFKLKQTLANFPRFPTVFLSSYFSLWICYETQIQRSKWAKQVGWVWQLTVQTFYLSSFDSKVKVKLFGAMLACLQSIHWCQGKTNQIISGVMKLSHILSRPLKRKDRLAFLLAATLGGQRKKQNMQK